jgi:hypothetical protein
MKMRHKKMARCAFRAAKPWNWYWPKHELYEDRAPQLALFAHWHQQFRSVR